MVAGAGRWSRKLLVTVAAASAAIVAALVPLPGGVAER